MPSAQRPSLQLPLLPLLLHAGLPLQLQLPAGLRLQLLLLPRPSSWGALQALLRCPSCPWLPLTQLKRLGCFQLPWGQRWCQLQRQRWCQLQRQRWSQLQRQSWSQLLWQV
jgi:hypothetical protein